jgi:hypothetical protein
MSESYHELSYFGTEAALSSQSNGYFDVSEWILYKSIVCEYRYEIAPILA